MRKLLLIAGVVVVLVVVIIVTQLNDEEPEPFPPPPSQTEEVTPPPALTPEPQPPAVGNLTVSFRNLVHNMGEKPKSDKFPEDTISNWCWLDVILTETTGQIGITVLKGEYCMKFPDKDLRCETRTNMILLFGTDYIPAGGSISGKSWYVNYPNHTIATRTYFGVDDNGNPVEARDSVELLR